MAFALRIVLAIAVLGGLGAGWYVWTENSVNERNAAMARTSAAVSQRMRPAPQVQVLTPPASDNPRATPDTTVDPAERAPVLQFPRPVPAQASGSPEPVPLEDLVARVGPAVVGIRVGNLMGTGFFVQPDTLITNAHVVGTAFDAKIRRTTGETLDVRVERVAKDIDLAVLKLSAPLANQAVLPLGSVTNVRSGEEVVAIGSALGVFQSSVTRGIVSAIRRTPSVTLIQTDAAINHGNSGGPLMDRTGTVIGITTMGYDNAQNVAFAVAADHARELMAGPRMATATSSPGNALVNTVTDTSEGDRARTAANLRYEKALATLARRADSLDAYWRRFKGDCYRGRVTGSADREWFAVFDPRAMQGAVAPGCGGEFDQLRTEAFTIKNTLEALDEAARKEDIYPGTRRDLRHKYRLELDR